VAITLTHTGRRKHGESTGSRPVIREGGELLRDDATGQARTALQQPDGTRTSTGRVAVVGATGAVLLLSGSAAARALLSEVAQPPVTVIALYGCVAIVAIAGMWIASRVGLQGRSGRQSKGSLPAVPGDPLKDALPDVAGTTSPLAVSRGSGHPPNPAVTPPPGAMDRRAEPAVEARTGAGHLLERLQVDTRSGRRIIATADVEWFEASGNYVRIHTADGSYLCRMPLAQFAQDLEPRSFVRVHRSAIVNLDAVHGVEPLPSGDAELRLASGGVVRMSRRYSRAFHERTGRGH
jgi:hypothetical protein